MTLIFIEKTQLMFESSVLDAASNLKLTAKYYVYIEGKR